MAVNNGMDFETVLPCSICRPVKPNLPTVAQAITNGKFVLFGNRDIVSPLINVSRLIGAIKQPDESMLAFGQLRSMTHRAMKPFPAFVGNVALGVISFEPKRAQRHSYAELTRPDENYGQVAA